MDVRTHCPSCQIRLKINSEHSGRHVRCPGCNEKFLFDGVADEPSASMPAVSSSAGDAITTNVTQTSTDVIDFGEKLGRHPSDPHLVLSCIAGLVIGLLIYLLVYSFARGTYLYALLLERQEVPYGIVFLTSWAAAILALKWREIRRQRRMLVHDLLPYDISERIRVEDVDSYRRNIHDVLAGDARRSFLASRVLRALDFFKSKPRTQDVSSLLASQAELETAAVDSSYTMVRVFIWAVPILGFIGTVVGISAAIQAFSSSIGGATELEGVKSSLGLVTNGLGVAFDTTLLALVTSILLMIPANWLQKEEEDHVNSVTDYCNDELLMRLDDGTQAEKNPASLVGAVLEQGLEHQKLVLDRWNGQLEAIGKTLAEKAAGAWVGLEEVMNRPLERHARLMEALLATATDDRTALVAEVRQMNSGLSASLDTVVRTLGEVTTRNETHLGAVQQQLVDAWSGEVASLKDELRTQRETSLADGREMAESLDALVSRIGGTLEAMVSDAKALQAGLANVSADAMHEMCETANEIGEKIQQAGDAHTQAASTVQDAIVKSAEEVADSLSTARQGELARLQEISTILGSLASAISQELPHRVEAHIDALSRSIATCDSLLDRQRELADATNSEALGRTLSGLEARLGDLGGALGQIDRRLASNGGSRGFLGLFGGKSS